MEFVFKKYGFQKRNDLSEADVIYIEGLFSIKLPKDYRYYLSHYEGYEGFVGKEYVRLWSVDELEENNKGYSIQEIEPSFFGIGSNMGGELIALACMSSDDFRVVLTPFIGMSKKDSIEIGNDFLDFLLRLESGREWFE